MIEEIVTVWQHLPSVHLPSRHYYYYMGEQLEGGHHGDRCSGSPSICTGETGLSYNTPLVFVYYIVYTAHISPSCHLIALKKQKKESGAVYQRFKLHSGRGLFKCRARST